MIAVNFNILNQKGAPAVFEDEAANRPPAGLVGRLFIATDTKTLQRDNGTVYDTIGDNSLLGARNGLTLAGNDVELGGTLIKHTALAGNYNIALGSAAVSNIKFLTSEASSTIIDGSGSIVGSKLYTPASNVSSQNFYIISGNLSLDLTNAKVTGVNTLNATALNGYVNINGNNGQSTRAIRSIMATAVFANVNLSDFRNIDIKAYDFSGTNSITNACGLYIDSLKTGAITNAYGIYQSGVNDKNYFAGAVDIISALTGTSGYFNGQFANPGAQTSYFGAAGIAGFGLLSIGISSNNQVGFAIGDPVTTTNAVDIYLRSTAGTSKIYTAGGQLSLGIGPGTSNLIIDASGNTSLTGALTGTQYNLSALNAAPSSASDIGTLGEMRITATYIYVCTATNTWVRSALATW